MIGHAMKYVDMAERVAAEMGARISSARPTGTEAEEVAHLFVGVLPFVELTVGGRIVADNLFKAEVSLVSAYRSWRDYMERAAENGSELAKQYLEETTWDLT